MAQAVALSAAAAAAACSFVAWLRFVIVGSQDISRSRAASGNYPLLLLLVSLGENDNKD